MSKIAFLGSLTGTGTVTVAAPVTNTNRTLTLPDSTGTMATAESTLAQFNASGAAPVYACRAWCNFNGTGTVAIRASGNVSSITDGGVGIYTVNFTTAMPDADYSAMFASSQPENIIPTTTSSSLGILSRSSAGANTDVPTALVTIFR